MNIVYKISLYALVVTSCFSWQNVQGREPALRARESYEKLLSINIFTNKSKRFNELQYLGALLVRDAFKRILDVCSDVDAITNAVRKNMRAIEGIIVNTPVEIAKSVHEAYTWASGSIDSLGLSGENFQSKSLKDDRLMYDYASGRDKETGARRILKLSQKKEFLTYELEILNERYAPIIKAITSKLKKQTILPPDITMLKDLYERVV